MSETGTTEARRLAHVCQIAQAAYEWAKVRERVARACGDEYDRLASELAAHAERLAHLALASADAVLFPSAVTMLAHQLTVATDALSASEAALERAEKERDEARDCGNSTTEDACGECRACWLITKASLCGRVAAAESALASEREAHEKTKLERDEILAELYRDADGINERPEPVQVIRNMQKMIDSAESVLSAEQAAHEETKRERDEARALYVETEERRSEALPQLAAAESRAERLAEALREEAAWLKDMAERTQHFVLPSSCGDRAERVRAVLAEVDCG